MYIGSVAHLPWPIWFQSGTFPLRKNVSDLPAATTGSLPNNPGSGGNARFVARLYGSA